MLIPLVIGGALWLYFLIVPAIREQRALEKSQDNLKVLGEALERYHAKYSGPPQPDDPSQNLPQ